MAAAKTAYVEDYNSTISEVVPLSRRHAQARKPSTLDTLREGTSDSGYEPSQHSSQLSPIASRAATPANEESSTAQAPQQSSQEQQQQVPQQTQQQTQQQQQAQQQRDQQLRDYYRHQEYQRYYQDRDAQQNASTPMQRRLSSHLSAQTSSSSSSNATPAGSRPNSVKASGSRDSSPAVHKHQTSHGGDNTVDGDSSCDCSQCKTKTSPPAAHSGLNTAWNLNYPPFTTAHHTPPYGPNYANVSPMRSYDYGRTRDRPIPTRPLSYGGANPVTTSGSWSAYGYYGQAPAASQSYGTPSYAPPPINTAVPATTAGTGPYSAMAGGYSGYVYPSPQEYWASTQATAAVPGSSSSAYEHTMHPPPIPTRRATTRVPSGVQNKSPRNSPGDYHQKYARKYAEEYADNKYSEKYPGGYDRYSRRYTEEYTDKYDDKYADYHQSGAPITRRMSQRTGQGSGAYAHLREEAIPTRSTSVPPSETGPVAPPEERRRTKTPGPPATRMRRDSTSTSGSANAALAGALTRVPKPNEYAIYDDDVYSRTPPSHHGHSRHSSRYDNRYEDYYGHPITPRHQYMYRGSDSSGASSGGVGEDLAEGVSDGETESYTMRRPPKGFPVSLSPPANPRHGNEGQIVENYSNDYRYMPHYEYAPRRTHELAVSHDVSMGGQGRELDKFDVGMPMRRGDTHRARRYSMGGVTRGISPRYSYW